MRPTRIAFRADARPQLGGGHIMRCLSTARELADRGCEVAFASAAGSADLVPALADAGLPVLDAEMPGHLPLPEHWNGRCDGLVVDLYDATPDDERLMHKRCTAMASYGELLHRKHACDILIDQNMGRHGELHADRVDGDCRFLLGPAYFAARPEFSQLRFAALKRREDAPLKRVLVTMGLTDLDAISLRLARAVLDNSALDVEVILGPAAASRDPLTEMAASEPRLTVSVGVSDVGARMAAADLAIGAGGGTAFERCILGLPSLVCSLAENQSALARALDEAGAAILVDAGDNLDADIARALQELTPERLTHLSQTAADLCDGRGAERIADALLDAIAALKVEVRPATPDDIWTVLDWRNREFVRANMYDSAPIDRATHANWFKATLDDPARELRIIRKSGVDLGVVFLSEIDRQSASCNWAFYLGEEAGFGRGLGGETERWVIDYVFGELGLTTLRCEVLRSNASVIGLHRKFGFQEIDFPAGSTTTPENQARSICFELRR